MDLNELIEVRRRLASPANKFAGWYQKPAEAGCRVLNALGRVLDTRLRIDPWLVWPRGNGATEAVFDRTTRSCCCVSG